MKIPEPGIALLMKLGSAIVHAEEYIETGHALDLAAFKQCAEDPEVKEWMTYMHEAALLPVKR